MVQMWCSMHSGPASRRNQWGEMSYTAYGFATQAAAQGIYKQVVFDTVQEDA